MIAALYVATNGVYFDVPGVDPWDAIRDAKKYNGPYPVVAHPPCGPWGRMAQFCHQDPECGPRAVEQVRAYGGVLEHPQGSRLWEHCGLPAVGYFRDAYGGTSFLVRQVAWGHACAKPTWLYVVGMPRAEVESRIVLTQDLSRQPTHKVRNRTAGNLLQASREMRSATPVGFRDLLIDIARTAGQSSCRSVG